MRGSGTLPTMASAIIFDDRHGRLGPLTELRASFEVRTGVSTSLERLERALGSPASLVARGAALAAAATERLGRPVLDADGGSLGDADDGALLVSGACVLPPEGLDRLDVGEALVEEETGLPVAARLSATGRAHLLRTGALSPGVRTRQVGRCALSRPWDVIRFRDRAIVADLAAVWPAPTECAPPGSGVIVIGATPLAVHRSARVMPGSIVDVSGGPVLIDRGATVRPGAVLCGPAWVGPDSTILDRAHLKAHSAIGPHCKIGGEVGGTIVQGHSNKGHEGHLGDAWLGEWVNLGAGTTNSNLLNTYGEVVARAGAGEPNERTGLTFLGCVLGDHTKTAIMTRIMTGAVVGAGVMWAASAPVSGAVAPFRWATDTGERPHRFDKMAATARAMMQRRGLELTAAQEALLREVCDASQRIRTAGPADPDDNGGHTGRGGGG